MTRMNPIARQTEGRWKNEHTYTVGYLPDQDLSDIPMKVSEPEGPGVIFWLILAIFLAGFVLATWALNMWMLA